MDFGLGGKKALVCAATKGLGHAVAAALAAEGVELFICARDGAAVADTATALAAQYAVPVHGIGIDLGTAGAAPILAAAARQAMGHVDILVNNIGGPSPSPALATTAAAWQLGFDQLFLSAVGLTQELTPAMIQRGFGRVITITSLSAMEPIEHLAVSNAMRAAVTSFSKTLADEVAMHGVTVNTVMPGVIHTRRIEQLRQAKAERDGSSLAAELAKTANKIPSKRLGRPQELAAAVCFLASEPASYITGIHLPVDGGLRRGL